MLLYSLNILQPFEPLTFEHWSFELASAAGITCISCNDIIETIKFCAPLNY